MSKSQKNLYDLCTMLRAEVNAAGLHIHTIKVVPQANAVWTAEYEAEGFRQGDYADQFAQLVAGMQAKYSFVK